jgi:hypothetical protein
MKLKSEDHKLLLIWALKCAERVLKYFEKEQPGDDRPHKALEVGRFVVKNGEATMAQIRKASLDSHAAARKCPENSPARFAARACGQAVATVHVQTHAPGAPMYALKALKALGKDIEKERTWQKKHLPKHLHAIGFTKRTTVSKKS